MHEGLDESKFRPDTNTISGVFWPCTSEKLMYNVVNTLAPTFLIGSSSFLQVIVGLPFRKKMLIFMIDGKMG